jgi:hypothetical protein
MSVQSNLVERKVAAMSDEAPFHLRHGMVRKTGRSKSWNALSTVCENLEADNVVFTQTRDCGNLPNLQIWSKGE